MAVDMFLKMSEKNLAGESGDAKHKGEIDVLAWSWGASNAGTAHLGGGSGAGKVNVQDLSITKYVDMSSPELFLHCCNGKHIGEATLVVRKAGGDPLEYITIVMTDCMITSLSTGGSGGEDRLTENVTINFASVKLTYKEQTAKGVAGKAPTVGWSMIKNIKL